MHPIPTLVIAGDLDNGSDGTVPIECTKFSNAQFVCLSGLSHSRLKNHSLVASVIRNFWLDRMIGETIMYHSIIQRLHLVPGITDGHWRDFHKAQTLMNLNNGYTIHCWTNFLGVEHIFVASVEEKCLYAGFVGWIHAKGLQQALKEIRQKYASSSSTNSTVFY